MENNPEIIKNNSNPEIIYVYLSRSESLIRAQDKYRNTHKELINAFSKSYYQKNRDKRLEYFKQRNAKKKLDKLAQTIESI